jgi:chromosome segregation ATPase
MTDGSSGDEWEDAGVVHVDDMNIDEKYCSQFLDPAEMGSQILETGIPESEKDEYKHIPAALMAMEERIRDRDRAQAIEISSLREQLERMRDALSRSREEAEEKQGIVDNLSTALEDQRAEHARALRQQSLLKSLVEHWQVECSQKETEAASLRRELTARETELGTKVLHLEAAVKTERRRREDLERALLQERQRVEQLDAENVQLDSGYQKIIAMLRKVSTMSALDRLELAFLFAINSRRAWRTLLGSDAQHLITMATDSQARLLPGPIPSKSMP